MPVIRGGTTTWNVARSTVDPHQLYWRQAETFRHDYLLTWDGSTPVDLSDTNVVILWDVVNATNQTEQWIASTGLVVNGTAGHIRISLTPEQSNISNLYYSGFVNAVELNGTNITSRGVTVWQTIQVKYSPDARYTTYHGPLSYAVSGSDTTALSVATGAWLKAVTAGTVGTGAWNLAVAAGATGSLAYANSANAQARAAILEANTQNWATAYGWGDHATAGYLTNGSTPTFYSGISIIDQTTFATVTALSVDNELYTFLGREDFGAAMSDWDAKWGGPYITNAFIGREWSSHTNPPAKLYIVDGPTPQDRILFPTAPMAQWIVSTNGSGGGAFIGINLISDNPNLIPELDFYRYGGVPALVDVPPQASYLFRIAWQDRIGRGVAGYMQSWYDETTNAIFSIACHPTNLQERQGGLYLMGYRDTTRVGIGDFPTTNKLAVYGVLDMRSNSIAGVKGIGLESGQTVTAQTVIDAERGASAYDWGDHAEAGYLTAESDPIWTATAPTTTTRSINGQTAFDWGDHSAAGYMSTLSVLSNGTAVGAAKTLNIVNPATMAMRGNTCDVTTAAAMGSQAFEGDVSISNGLLIVCSTGASLRISSTNTGVAIGKGAAAGATSVAIGPSANASENADVAIGDSANAYYAGTAVGDAADGRDYGAAIGISSYGRSYGASVGRFADSYVYGVAVGNSANGRTYGVAVGSDARGVSNVAVGAGTLANAAYSTALGRAVTNSVNESTKVRGALYVWQPSRLAAHPTPETNTLILYTLGTNGSGYAMNEGGIAGKITSHNEYGDDTLVTYDDITGIERTVNLTLRDELMLKAEDVKGIQEAIRQSVSYRQVQPPRAEREQAKGAERQKEIDEWTAAFGHVAASNRPPKPDPYTPVAIADRPTREKD